MLNISVEDEIAYIKRRAAALGLKVTKTRKKPTGMPYSQFPNFGKGWSDEQLDELEQLFNAEATLPDMVKALGRSPGSILGRLAARKVLTYDVSGRGYAYLQAPKRGEIYITYKQFKELGEKYGW